MPLSLHTLKPNVGARTKKFRVGRGLGSGRGKTAGRGTKGQRARTGGRKRLKLKGMKQMLLGFPKLRGFQSRFAKVATVPLLHLAIFQDGSTINLKTLREKGIIRRADRMAKIVGSGELGKKLHVVGLKSSSAAKASIERAGGSLK